MPAKLKSRIPQIIVTMEGRTDAAMRAGAETIERLATARAPVGTGPDDPHPGRLKDSIHVERWGKANFRVFASAQADKRLNGSEGAYYAAFLEFGAYGDRIHHPFMIPALEQAKDEVVGLEVTVLRKL